MDLAFKKIATKAQIKEVYDYTIEAFSDSPDFNWTVEEIEKEVKEGWELNGVYLGEEIIAAVFFKKYKESLLTKNTAIKVEHQGSGYSHRIKEFFENKARELNLTQILHYCRIDNFRMYSLNESHGYKKTGARPDEDDQVVEWAKVLT